MFFGVLVEFCLLGPLGLDRHIQAISAGVQWICQSTVSSE